MIKKYLRIYKTFLANALSYEAQYRANMWLNIILNLIWISMLFVFIETFFRFTTTLGGWEKPEVYLLSLLWIFTVELAAVLFSGIFRLPIDVNEGNIDLLIVKPLNSLFLMSLRQIRFSSSYYLILEVPLLIWFVIHYDFIHSFSSLCLALLLFVCGLIIYYSVLLIINTLGFWFERFDNINDVWLTLHEMGQYPLHILPKFFKVLFFTFAPIAFTAYVPVSMLKEQLPTHLIWYTILFTGFLFLCAVSFWNFAIKKYSSASS